MGNFCRFFWGFLLDKIHFREMDYVDEQAIPYGEQAQLDYGQELLEDSSIVHFIALELRRSRDKGVQRFSFRARSEPLCLPY